jgi:hypothetical protein
VKIKKIHRQNQELNTWYPKLFHLLAVNNIMTTSQYSPFLPKIAVNITDQAPHLPSEYSQSAGDRQSKRPNLEGDSLAQRSREMQVNRTSRQLPFGNPSQSQYLETRYPRFTPVNFTDFPNRQRDLDAIDALPFTIAQEPTRPQLKMSSRYVRGPYNPPSDDTLQHAHGFLRNLAVAKHNSLVAPEIHRHQSTRGVKQKDRKEKTKVEASINSGRGNSELEDEDWEKVLEEDCKEDWVMVDDLGAGK